MVGKTKAQKEATHDETQTGTMPQRVEETVRPQRRQEVITLETQA